MTSVLRPSSSSSSLASLASDPDSRFNLLFNKLASQIISSEEHMNTTDGSVSQPDPQSASEPLDNTAASTSMANPLKEELTEPYYPDDAKHAPQPTAEELAALGIKVRDFAYESKIPPLKPFVRKLPDPNRIQMQPDPNTWTGLVGGSVSGRVSSSGKPLERLVTDGLVRQRVFNGLDELEESQQGNLSSPAHSQSQPPLEYITSQESDEIQTPFVTPNGSLQWRDTSDIPIDDLDNSSPLSAADIPDAKPLPARALPFLSSPQPSLAELTLPNLSSPSNARLASQAFEPPSRFVKRMRTTLPESPSPPSHALDSSRLPLNAAPSPPLPPRYHFRTRRPTTALPEPPAAHSPALKPVRPRVRSSLSVQSAQAKAPTQKNGRQGPAPKSGDAKGGQKSRGGRKTKSQRD
ncbi:hypothetical protein D9757_001309 [Collybiopsis confluens]|uniref:Uncharacterized protein n=1 Tax=Collybiopsis confluens TaxID=2823264 RepID=A0A8H5I175_9AGAR|nr:hypothetical protein D9757_001309 [Collybiopsis confluens]